MSYKSQILTFVVEVESDQDVPDVGAFGDWSNNDWTFLDVRLAAVSADSVSPDHITDAIHRALSA